MIIEPMEYQFRSKQQSLLGNDFRQPLRAQRLAQRAAESFHLYQSQRRGWYVPDGEGVQGDELRIDADELPPAIRIVQLRGNRPHECPHERP